MGVHKLGGGKKFARLFRIVPEKLSKIVVDGGGGGGGGEGVITKNSYEIAYFPQNWQNFPQNWQNLSHLFL
jgi:hypothetical protein